MLMIRKIILLVCKCMYHTSWTRYLRRYPSVIGVACQTGLYVGLCMLNIDLAKKRIAYTCNTYTSLRYGSQIL